MNNEVTLAGTGPAGDGEEVDVLYLAGQEPSLAGAWLLVTEADGKPGGMFTAHVLGDAAPSAFGGDVLVRLLRDDPAEGQPPPAARVQVFAVIGGRLIPVAVWPGHDLDSWPERIRPLWRSRWACSPNWRSTARTRAAEWTWPRQKPRPDPACRCTSPSPTARPRLRCPETSPGSHMRRRLPPHLSGGDAGPGAGQPQPG